MKRHIVFLFIAVIAIAVAVTSSVYAMTARQLTITAGVYVLGTAQTAELAYPVKLSGLTGTLSAQAAVATLYDVADGANTGTGNILVGPLNFPANVTTEFDLQGIRAAGNLYSGIQCPGGGTFFLFYE